MSILSHTNPVYPKGFKLGKQRQKNRANPKRVNAQFMFIPTLNNGYKGAPVYKPVTNKNIRLILQAYPLMSQQELLIYLLTSQELKNVKIGSNVYDVTLVNKVV